MRISLVIWRKWRKTECFFSLAVVKGVVRAGEHRQVCALLEPGVVDYYVCEKCGCRCVYSCFVLYCRPFIGRCLSCIVPFLPSSFEMLIDWLLLDSASLFFGGPIRALPVLKN